MKESRKFSEDIWADLIHLLCLFFCFCLHDKQRHPFSSKLSSNLQILTMVHPLVLFSSLQTVWVGSNSLAASMWATTLSVSKQTFCNASKSSLTQLSRSGVLVTSVGALGERMSCLRWKHQLKCFFGRGKKNRTVIWTGQVGLSVRIVALACSTALEKAAAKDF